RRRGLRPHAGPRPRRGAAQTGRATRRGRGGAAPGGVLQGRGGGVTCYVGRYVAAGKPPAGPWRRGDHTSIRRTWPAPLPRLPRAVLPSVLLIVLEGRFRGRGGGCILGRFRALGLDHGEDDGAGDERQAQDAAHPRPE